MHQVRRNRQTSSEIMESAMFQAAAIEIDNFLSEGNTRRADSRVRQLLMEILRTYREESGQRFPVTPQIPGETKRRRKVLPVFACPTQA